MMTYFGLLWWPIGKALQVLFFLYFMWIYFRNWVRNKLRKSKN